MSHSAFQSQWLCVGKSCFLFLGEHYSSIHVTCSLDLEDTFSNPKNRYDNDQFPQLLGQTTINDYNLAIHVLEKNNMFTVREIDAMINNPNEDEIDAMINNPNEEYFE